MSDNNVIKFVYRSQNIPDTEPIMGSNKTITSGGVWEAINNIQMNTLFKSGYLPEGVASVKPVFKLTFEDGTLTLKAGSKVSFPDGFTEPNAREEVFHKYNTITIEEDVVLSASAESSEHDGYVFYDANENKLVILTKRANVIDPLTGEKQNSVVQKVYASETQPTIDLTNPTYDGTIWWDLTNNLIKVANYAQQDFVPSQYSIPLGLVGREGNTILGLYNNFETCGICESIVWVNAGVSFLVPTGIEKDRETGEETGRYANEVIDTTDVISKVVLTGNEDNFSNDALYINVDGDSIDILGPMDELSFDYEKGLFTDGAQDYSACKFATMSGEHLTTASNDKLTWTSFAPRPVLALADSEDIEYIVRLIGSSMGLTIDDLQDEIEAAARDRESLRAYIREQVELAKDDVANDIHKLCVHKEMPGSKYFTHTDSETGVVSYYGYEIHNGNLGATTDTQYFTDNNGNLYPYKKVGNKIGYEIVNKYFFSPNYENQYPCVEVGDKIGFNKVVNNVTVFVELTRTSTVNESYTDGETVYILEERTEFVELTEDGDVFKDANNVSYTLVTKTEFTIVTKVNNTEDTYKDASGKRYTLVVEDENTSALYPYLTVNETIQGVKTFEETIQGDINGLSQHVNITSTSGEIMPLGIASYNNDSHQNNVQVNTSSVRIGSDYVKATTFDGTATKARWADLAEIYETDKEYPVGTLLRWGGEKELTVAGHGVANAVVSEKPALLMNSGAEGQPIALVGRVRVRVTGRVHKHDAIVLNEMIRGVGKVQESSCEAIVARALEENLDEKEKLVLCVVRFSL